MWAEPACLPSLGLLCVFYPRPYGTSLGMAGRPRFSHERWALHGASKFDPAPDFGAAMEPSGAGMRTRAVVRHRPQRTNATLRASSCCQSFYPLIFVRAVRPSQRPGGGHVASARWPFPSWLWPPIRSPIERRVWIDRSNPPPQPRSSHPNRPTTNPDTAARRTGPAQRPAARVARHRALPPWTGGARPTEGGDRRGGLLCDRRPPALDRCGPSLNAAARAAQAQGQAQVGNRIWELSHGEPRDRGDRDPGDGGGRRP